MGRCRSHQSYTVNDHDDDHSDHAHRIHSQTCTAVVVEDADNVAE